MPENHNHHCILTFDGRNYRIAKCRKDRILVRRTISDEIIYQTIDTSKVNWDAYCNAAVETDRQ